MLNEYWIMEEARKRVENMDPAELEAFEERIRDGKRLVQKVVWEGDKSLTKEEWSRFSRYEIDNMRNQGANGDFDYTELEMKVTSMLGVSRDQIAGMKKNPFAPGLRRALLITAIVGIGGNVGTALLAKATGWDLGYLYIGFSSVTGLLALRVGEQAVRVFRFRRLQQAYNKPDFQEGAINAAVYRIIKERVEEEMSRE